ncbi:serine/arginine repetitive matrix protein 2 [Anopheles bellator]|uniref:serine/arginine repetitive matrix protein 2 n=1 Tax=Anopheles bellator TaxID=139047 RepID=UPI002647764E|nr:serine/arginine repetitive matrix protein 2 [Anopheles bellator]
MWNKLFKSKSKSSKNLSNRSSSSGANGFPEAGTSQSSVAQFEQYGSNVGLGPEPVRMRPRPDAHALDLAVSSSSSSSNQHRDSIGAQMSCIPMRRSKLSSAFKSFSLKRSASKSRLKLLATASPSGTAADGPTAGPGPTAPGSSGAAWNDDYEILTAGKRASLRPCKSDNNLNEKQQYTDGEKEEPVYIEECNPYEKFSIPSEPPPNLQLQACPICSRKFATTSLLKHIGICERVQTKKRKPFDSSRQRREGTELASYLPKNFGLPHKTVSGSHEAIPVRKLSLSKTPTFERKEFNATAMSTSMPSSTSTPKPALKRSMSQQNEPCPYCERCFGMKAYDRHVEWCREKALLSKNVNNNQSISAAKERLQARIQYRAPQLRSKRAFTRDKYSGSLSCGGSTNSLAELDLHMPRHNSMSSSVSSDNRKSNPSASLQQLSLTIGNNATKEANANKRREETRKVTKRTKTFTFSSDRLHSDSNNNCNNANSNYSNHTGNRLEPGGRTQTRNLLKRSTVDQTTMHRQDKTRTCERERVEKFEIIGHSKHDERMTHHRPVGQQSVRTSTSSSGYSPDRYDPFLSARRQLEELFSPATSLIHTSSPASTTSTSRLNQTAGTDTKSTGGASKTSPLNSNFRRAYSLRMPRKVSRPMYIEKAKSNIQKGITDDGPVSPNFLKSSEYDEIPIKSTFNALQMAEKPKLRDSSTVRKNLKLDIKDLNHPAVSPGGELPLSKTDSLAVFLKYETELALSEKDMKDKSNSISKRSSSLSAEAATQAKKQDCSANNNNNVPAAAAPHGITAPKPETPTTEPPEQKITPRSVPSAEENLAKKQALKLVPIKLEPINITYSSGGSASESTNRRPTVISLDAIIGKGGSNAKPKPQFERETRPDVSYIDPKLINKCDNLPINLVKTVTLDVGRIGIGRGNTVAEVAKPVGNSSVPVETDTSQKSDPPVPPPRATIKVVKKQLELTTETLGATPCNSNKDNAGVPGLVPANSSDSSNSSSTAASPVDNRNSAESTNIDKRPQLTRQDREDSGYRTGQDSEHDSCWTNNDGPQLSKKHSTSSTAATVSHTTPSPGTERGVKGSATQVTNDLNRKTTVATALVSNSTSMLSPRSHSRERPLVPDLDDFDVDEFMMSLEDLQRRSPATAKDYKQSLFCRTSSTVTGGSSIVGQATSAGSKRSNSLDSSNSLTNHFDGSSGVPRVDLRVRNGSGTPSNHNSSNSSSSISSPRHYGSSFNSNAYYSNAINNNTTHNHSNGNGGSSSKEAPSPSSEALRPLAQRLNYARNSPILSRRASQESTPYSPSPTGGTNGSVSTVQNLPNIHQASGGQHHESGTANNNNHSATTRPYYSTPSPVNGRSIRYSNSSYQANSGAPSATTPASSSLAGYFHEPRYPPESFDHLERDLLKSVQELDRMCGSSSSVCSIDSEELYSVEDYPLHKRPSERSQASADSAYRSSLSTQSPPDYAPPVPIRQGYPGSRSSTGHIQPPQSLDSSDSAYNAHHAPTSLPPLTNLGTPKASKPETLPHKDSESVAGLILNPMSKFCHECGARFMISSAKFCMSCGVRRIMLE